MNIWDNLPKPFLILAPMEGVTDVVFRAVIAAAGRPDLFFTEFTNVSSYASEKGRENALERLEINSTDKPIIAQIWGKNPAHFAEICQALGSLGFSGIDLNFGCPDKHVNKAGGGAAMIKTPGLAIECIKSAKSATSLPVSVKTRLGFTYIDEYKTWLPLLLEQNLSALTVHLRTRKEMSKVPAHFELIPEIIKLRDKINGDINDIKHVQELSKTYPEVDGFMIGRGVFKNPFCFNKEYIDKKPSKEDLQDLLEYHLSLFDKRQKELEKRNSRYPYEPLKHFFKIYINNFTGASGLRAKIMDCHDTASVRALLKSETTL